mgnify:CR=1
MGSFEHTTPPSATMDYGNIPTLIDIQIIHQSEFVHYELDECVHWVETTSPFHL